MYLNGKDLRTLPLIERKAMLKRLLRRKRSRILYLDHVEGDGRLLFEQIVKMDLEGIDINPSSEPSVNALGDCAPATASLLFGVVDELPDLLGTIRGRGDVIHLLVHGDRWQPFRRGGPLQLNSSRLKAYCPDGFVASGVTSVIVPKKPIIISSQV